MSWENYGEWHIDHKVPLKYNKPSLEEVVQRLHYTNTQPMWASENISKGCQYISGWPWPLFRFWLYWTNIKRTGNCIPKFSKDLLLGLENFMKNATPFEKEKLKRGLDRLTGGTYTRIHSIKGVLKKETLALLQTGVWWRNLFRTG